MTEYKCPKCKNLIAEEKFSLKDGSAFYAFHCNKCDVILTEEESGMSLVEKWRKEQMIEVKLGHDESEYSVGINLNC